MHTELFSHKRGRGPYHPLYTVYSGIPNRMAIEIWQKGPASYWPGVARFPSGERSGEGSDFGEPVFEFGVFAANDVEEGFLDAVGGVAFGPGANGAVVDLADRGDLGGGAGQENFVGQVQHVPGQRLLFQRDVQLVADAEHRVAGDAVQATARQRRGKQGTSI